MFLKKKVYDALKKDILISDEMEKAIRLWKDCYRDKAPWINEDVKSLNLCASISSEFARQVTLELSSVVTGGKRAQLIDECYQKMLKRIRAMVEYACAMGAVVFKPYVLDGKLHIEFVGADNFFPTKVDGKGEIISGAFCEQKKVGEKHYIRIEHHEMRNSGVEITNRAFRADPFYASLSEVTLDKVPDWEAIAPFVFLKGVKKPLFSYFKIPFANNIDPTSPLGVSVFSRAVNTICEADKQYSRLLWEFEGGELAIDASIDAVKSVNGDIKMPHLNKRLFRGLDIDGGNCDLYSVFAPALRDESLINGLDQIMVRIEDLCGLARGVFSNMDSTVRTATELNILRQRTYSSVTDIQKSLADALEVLIDAMSVLCDVYSLAPQGNLFVNFDFDDSTVSDRQTEFMERQSLVEQGVMSKWELRAWYLGESEEEAKERMAENDLERCQNQTQSDKS